MHVVDLDGTDFGPLVTAEFGTDSAIVLAGSTGTLAAVQDYGDGRLFLNARTQSLLWDQPNCTGAPFISSGNAAWLHGSGVLPAPLRYWRAIPGVAAALVTFQSYGEPGSCNNALGTPSVVPAEDVTNLLSFSSEGNSFVGSAPFHIVQQ